MPYNIRIHDKRDRIMFGKLFRKLHKNTNENSVSFRWEMARHIDGKHIKYVTERVDGVESVVGHEGAVILREDELLVYASSDIVFRSKVPLTRMSELLSLEGVILTGPDLQHDGAERTIIAYYTYYIK